MDSPSKVPVAHVAVVRLWFEAWNSRDLGGLLELMDPAIEFRPVAPRGVRLRDREQFVQWYRGQREGAASLHLEVADVASLDTRRVLVTGRVLADEEQDRGVEFTAIYTVAEDRIVSVEQYLSDTTLMKQLGILQAVLMPDGRAIACPHCAIVIETQRPIVMVRRPGGDPEFWHQDCFTASHGPIASESASGDHERHSSETTSLD